MNDRRRLIELLDAWGVGWKPGQDNNVILSEGSAKISGYGGFYTAFEFDDAGAFVQVGAWE